MLACSGCNRHESAKRGGARPTGTIEATWNFWETFSKAATSGTGIEALESPAWKGDVDTADTCDVIEDIIAGERRRSRAITSLPVFTHVDPDLSEYAVQSARSRSSDLADAMQDCAGLNEKAGGEMTSARVLGVGLLLNLLNHSDDKQDGILWRALLDEARRRRERIFKLLREPASAVEARAASVRSVIGRLNAAEDAACESNSAQRFDSGISTTRDLRQRSRL